jgi:hypothetical protein
MKTGPWTSVFTTDPNVSSKSYTAWPAVNAAVVAAESVQVNCPAVPLVTEQLKLASTAVDAAVLRT